MQILPKRQHPWDLNEAEAIALQDELRQTVVKDGVRFEDIETVMGLDVAYGKEADTVAAAAVVLDFKTFEIIEEALAVRPLEYPYIPGLFSFREMPPLIDAVAKLKTIPDLVVCDGHGQNHPRRFGLACHFGVLYDLPTIGCAKKPLIGKYADLTEMRGSRADICHQGEVIGSALRTQTKIKPVYVSIGHRCSLSEAERILLHLCPDYRLPMTTRIANTVVNAHHKELE